MKLYLKSKIINIKLLQDLKANFDVVYSTYKDCTADIILDEYILYVDEFEIACGDRINDIEQGTLSTSLSEYIKLVYETCKSGF
ncbi:MAG: hypothetical protein ACLS2V_13115 [Clostridium paraputrificum]|uniref:hypothetical protein n=1 Tax=Clostridium sp. TaxID=1506 RepID=UPI0025C50D15|nr:hypothetical protein [Clostridium sp.]MBS5926172.1 hypothetical protein [Clostridium sp.]